MLINDFSLAEARERARQVRQQLADGIDPIEARLAARDAQRRDDAARMTFKDAAGRYLAVHEAMWRNAKHRQQWRNTLAAYAFPTLGTRPVGALDAAVDWREIPAFMAELRQRDSISARFHWRSTHSDSTGPMHQHCGSWSPRWSVLGVQKRPGATQTSYCSWNRSSPSFATWSDHQVRPTSLARMWPPHWSRQEYRRVAN